MKKLLVLSAVLIACGVGLLVVLSMNRPKSAPAANGRGEPDAVYATRGRIMMLPSPKNPAAELQIHHEPISEFVNANGTVGMPSMIMPFPVGSGTSLDGLAVGDPVEFDFAAWTTPGNRHYEARRIRKLPADTKLDLPE